ncbi:MAG: hypothetical protein KGL35_24950 [Bradyrhizobium sp.]|nr:hypothetical protein [Bradyrhizobium sp.]
MTVFSGDVPQTTLNITVATLIKAAPGMLVSFSVNVAGAAGTINDAATVGAAAAANAICATPAAVEAVFFPAKFQNGLVVVPGAGQTVTVTWT